MLGLPVLGIALIVSLLVGGVGSGLVVHKIDEAKYAQLEAKYAKAESEALKQAEALRQQYEQKRVDEAVAWESQKQGLMQQSRAANQKVERYVKNSAGSCITYGALRLLDGEGILGSGAERLPLPSGKSDDSCAPITAVVFHRTLVNDLASCRQNSAQLNALIASVRPVSKK
jgi:hypothetical protein